MARLGTQGMCQTPPASSAPPKEDNTCHSRQHLGGISAAPGRLGQGRSGCVRDGRRERQRHLHRQLRRLEAAVDRPGGRSARVTLTDGAERPLASLGDGAEVTILAWLPGWAGTTRYCVHVTDSGLEGWLQVGDLRGTRNAISSPPAVSPPLVVRPAFGAGSSGRSGRPIRPAFLE